MVLRFESEEAALAWYNDPEYAAPKAVRIGASANGTLTLAKAFSMPAGG